MTTETREQKPNVSHDLSRNVRIGPKVQCIAKSKTTQNQCKNNALPEMTVCKFHGGMTPRGRASKLWKHGKYSRHLPSKLAPRYEEALADPELMSLKHDIAITEARLTELMEKIDSGEAKEVWDNLRKTVVRQEKAIQSGNRETLRNTAMEIQQLVSQGVDEFKAYADIQSTQEHRRKMTETENKMLIAKQQMVSTEQVMQLMGIVLEVLQRGLTDHITNVTERTKCLTAISTDFTRLSVLET